VRNALLALSTTKKALRRSLVARSVRQALSLYPVLHLCLVADHFVPPALGPKVELIPRKPALLVSQALSATSKDRRARIVVRLAMPASIQMQVTVRA